MGHGRRKAEAEQASDGSSWRSYPHRAKPGSGLNPTQVKSCPVQAAWASPGRSRATQGRGQPLQSTGRAGSLLGWGPAQIQPARPKARQAARASHGRSRATQGREQPLPTGRSPGRVGSPLGWYASGGAQCCMGVAWLKPGDEGWAQPLSIRARPGSGQEPTRVGSGPGSACAAEGAPDCMGVAWPKPTDSGEGIATSPPGEARVGPEARSGGGPTQVRPAQPKARQTAWALQGRSRAPQERVLPLPTGQSLDLAGGLFGWGPAQIQPSWPKARPAARASHGRSQAAQARVGPGAHSGGAQPRFSLRGRRRGRAARASSGRSRAVQGRAQPLPALQIQGRAGSLLGLGPAQIQPAQPEEH